jgi:predicted nucleic acid-binding Zn ribbon protein
MKKKCLECGDEFVGRVDKKFCSDQCRNTYNNRQNADSTNFIRNINHILRKNRKILAELNPDGKAKVHRNKLLEKGFNFNYYTNIYKTKAEKEYYFCYDMGYLAIENEYFMLFVRKEYVE